MSNAKLGHRNGFRPKLIALSVAACFSLSATHAAANPTGGSVASGSATIVNSGSTLTITNSANAIINWQSFSIGVNEITRFLQGSGSSAVLNRVVGANGVIPQSVIDGVLSSNGRVFLLNSSGILIGSNARIDVAGFIASSLNLSDKDFAAGRMRFTETPGAGGVSNAGTIDTTSAGPGGRVFLIGPDVQNSGIIRTPQGQIILAAGKSVELVSENSPFVTVSITADSEQALNVGKLIADSGRIGMFGALVRQGGVVEANSAVAGANGEIRLVATKDLTLDAGSVTTANGPSGGNVLLQAQGGTNAIYGTVEAKGSAGQGGTIQALGVRVGVIGNAVIDASGDTGGGTVLVGGDAHGANPNVQNAERTLIGPDGVIRADAGTTGDGGRVIVWADGDTRFYGSISAQGGAQSGNGGFIETSGALGLDIQGGRVDARAPNGTGGTWLLDPLDVTIIYGNNLAPGTDPAVGIAANIGVDNFAANPVNGGLITSGTLEANFLNVGTTRIQATRDVMFKSDLNLQYGIAGQTFEVRAEHNIDLAADGIAHTIATNGHNVVLSANDIGPNSIVPQLNPAAGPYGFGSILGGGNINANSGGGAGGNITLSGYGVNVGTLQTAGGLDTRTGALTGNVTITAIYGGVQTGNITTSGVKGVDFDPGKLTQSTAGGSGGNVTITTSGGIVVTGNIDASGGRGGNGGLANGFAYSGASGGAGGNVIIQGTQVGISLLNPASITTGSISSYGGSGGFGGSGGAYVTTAAILDVGLGGDGGSGGSVLLTAGSISTGAVNTSGASGGAGGGTNIVTLYGVLGATAGSGDLTVGDGGFGGSGGQVTMNANSISTGSITTAGGAGGAGGGGNNATVIVNAGPGNIAQASGNAEAGFGGDGGFAGFVQLSAMGPVNVSGAITTTGGAGGIGGAGSKANTAVYGSTNASTVFAGSDAGSGGRGSSGNSVIIGGTNVVVTGDIITSSGAGGAGGGNSSAIAYASSLIPVTSSFQAIAFSGVGGDAGFNGGSVNISGSTINAGKITTAGGAAGAAGVGSSATVSGYGAVSTLSSTFAVAGLGEFGGSVLLSGTAGVKTGAIDTSGSGPGDVSITSDTGDIVTGAITTRSFNPGFAGGQVGLSTAYGHIAVYGGIDTRGSDGVGVQVDTCGDGCIGFAYGGSSGGIVILQRTGATDPGGTAIQVYGGILASGGDGFSPQGAAGGNGGYGGSVIAVTTYGGIAIGGGIDIHAGYGGAGAAGFAGGYGGSGGTAFISASGTTIPVSGGGTFYGSVAVAGNIDAFGGSGGAGGLGYGGGLGGYGGAGFLIGSNVSSGAINVSGGAGGAGGADNGTTGAGNGGYGGAGGGVELLASGRITVGNIFATGGAGGVGGKGNGIRAGTGGAGGYGGDVLVETNGYGTIDMTSGGTIKVAGGAGGAGGAGDPVKGGDGGYGGNGGSVDIFAPYGSILASGPLSIDGVVLDAGALSLGQTLANGGAGGAGGADFGLGAGTAGANGLAGSLNLDGTVSIALTDFLSLAAINPELQQAGNAVIQGTNQLINPNPNTAPPSDELDKKQKDDKQKKQAAACK